MFLQTLWLLLAYSYNVVLVLFIATHLFVGAIISFLVGLYIGVYLTQNYEVPRINEPKTLWDKFLTFLETNRRDPQKISVKNILQPSTIKELVLEEQLLAETKGSETAFITATSEESQKEDNVLIEDATPLENETLLNKDETQETEVIDEGEINMPKMNTDSTASQNHESQDDNTTTTLILTGSVGKELEDLKGYNYKDISSLEFH